MLASISLIDSKSCTCVYFNMPCWFLATRGLDAFHDYIHTVGPVFIAIVFLLVCRHLVSYRATTPGTTLPAPTILYTVLEK